MSLKFVDVNFMPFIPNTVFNPWILPLTLRENFQIAIIDNQSCMHRSNHDKDRRGNEVAMHLTISSRCLHYSVFSQSLSSYLAQYPHRFVFVFVFFINLLMELVNHYSLYSVLVSITPSLFFPDAHDASATISLKPHYQPLRNNEISIIDCH